MNIIKLQNVMRINHSFICFLVSTLFIATTAVAQTANFDETWKEFLVNNQISNMSVLMKPNKAQNPANYAKYLLMNTNTSFCQSDMEDAEELMAEIKGMGLPVQKSIPRFMEKMDDIEKKIKAYHSMDGIWMRFLKTREVDQGELEAIVAAKTTCEKRTLAKYSFMTAHAHLCEGNVTKAKNIFETRTLRLTEKTSLRIEDVEGLEEEVARMKGLFEGISTLDVVWNEYVKTGVSPGFDKELPFFPCYPIPNMKVLVLNGATDICNAAPKALEKLKQLQKESGVTLYGDLKDKVRALEADIKGNNKELATLNKAWEAFIPDNTVRMAYGYEYCEKEPLIRAYIMDGFASVCDLAEEVLQQIDEIQREEVLDLDRVTITKIKELREEFDAYQANEAQIKQLWQQFKAEGDTLLKDDRVPTTEMYCDNISQVKDWTMNGLCGTCDESYQFLDQIEEFRSTFEFSFTEDLECRLQKLRIKAWDCRYQILQEMASIEVSSDSSYEERLEGLMEEYAIGDRPEACQ